MGVENENERAGAVRDGRTVSQNEIRRREQGQVIIHFQLPGAGLATTPADPPQIFYMCFLSVFSSHSFWTSSSLDAPAGVTAVFIETPTYSTSNGNTTVKWKSSDTSVSLDRQERVLMFRCFTEHSNGQTSLVLYLIVILI